MKSIKHLLVIRLSAMGDVAMSVPVLSAFCKQHPNIKVTVLTRAFFAPLFLQLPNVGVYTAELNGKHKGIFGLLKLYRELKALKIDAVADIHNVLRSNILKGYFKLGNIAVAQINKGRTEKKALTAARNKVFKPLKTTHQRYADVFRQLGFLLDISNVAPIPKLPLSIEVDEFIGSTTKKRIGIAPFAAFAGKMYPMHLMEEVLDSLNASEVYSMLLFGGGKKELEHLAIWEKKYQNAVNVSQKFSFTEELTIISSLDVMISMDSGNGHLAALFAIPTITLWGVTHPYAGFVPYGQDPDNALLADREKFPLIPTSIYGNKMPKGYEKCMETVHPQEILKKIDTLVV